MIILTRRQNKDIILHNLATTMGIDKLCSSWCADYEVEVFSFSLIIHDQF